MSESEIGVIVIFLILFLVILLLYRHILYFLSFLADLTRIITL